jgi:hypothetical protein
VRTIEARIRIFCLKAQKGRFAMKLFPPTASSSVPSPAGGIEYSRQAEDRTYKVATVAAILLLLGSLWMF